MLSLPSLVVSTPHKKKEKNVIHSYVDEDMPLEATQVTHKHVYDGPITRSRAKLLQKEVNSFLSKTNFNIFEDVVLPKCSTLILLRHVHKED